MSSRGGNPEHLRGFLGSVAALGSGTLVAQIAPILAAPILSRLFLPAEFGSYSLFFAVVTPIGVVAALCYELAIQLAPRQRDAIRLAQLAVVSALIVAALSMLTVVAFDRSGFLLEQRTQLGSLLYLLPAGILIYALTQVASNWANRIGRFRVKGVSMAATGLTTVAGQLVAGGLRAGSPGLTLAALVGQLAGFLVLLRKGIGGRLSSIKLPGKQAARLAREYSDMPTFSAPAALLTTLSTMLPILALSSIYGAAATGLFALSYRVTYLPVSVLSASANQVFFRQFTKLRESGESGADLLLKVWAAALMAAALPAAALFFFGEQLFEFVFGSEWYEAGRIASIMSFSLLFSFVLGSTNSAAVVLRVQHLSLGFSATSVFVKIALILAASTYNLPLLTLVAGFVGYECLELVVMSAILLVRSRSIHP